MSEIDLEAISQPTSVYGRSTHANDGPGFGKNDNDNNDNLVEMEAHSQPTEEDEEF